MRPADLPRCFELKYNEKKSWVVAKREEACSVPAKSAGSEDERSVLPRGSGLQVTNVAAFRGPSLRRDLLVGLADAHGSHFHSHPHDGPSC